MTWRVRNASQDVVCKLFPMNPPSISMRISAKLCSHATDPGVHLDAHCPASETTQSFALKIVGAMHGSASMDLGSGPCSLADPRAKSGRYFVCALTIYSSRVPSSPHSPPDSPSLENSAIFCGSLKRCGGFAGSATSLGR